MGNCYAKKNVQENNLSRNKQQKQEKYKVIEWKDTIPFVVPIKGGRVIKVYDGDTITIASHLPYNDSPLFRFSVRLNGIDTPEIKGKNENEKKVASLARDALRDKIMQKDVKLMGVQSEKYGRVLATVYFNNENINQWMINEHYAVEYDGGTKKCPDDWLAYYNSKLKINTKLAGSL